MGRGEVPPDMLLRTVAERLERVEPVVRAYRWRPPAPVGPPGRRMVAAPLDGVPLAVKDLFDVEGMPTTGGSAAYHWFADQDAPAVAALRQAGAWVVGKTHTRELAFGITCPPTANPWGLNRIPGGSSGGSAAALAAGLAWAALGTDTAGSIRIPAACCGVVGLKPSTGCVSTSGVMPLSWTLDHVGPLARSVADAAALFQIVARRPVVAVPEPPRRVRIPEEYLEGWVDGAVAPLWRGLLDALQDAGIPVLPVAMEPFEKWVGVFRGIRLPEAFAYHRPVLESEGRHLLGPGLAERLEEGREVPAWQYLDAMAARRALQASWQDRLDPGDQVWMPTLPVTAPLEGQDPVSVAGRPVDLWTALVRFTLPWNVLGWPALSVPVGVAEDGLPVAFQIIGPAGSDEGVLAAGRWWETLRGPWVFPAGGFRA
jgi:aspartyl-tRNA(Asn)/glutamyl-tRNA(Gln) amidotransferase subunit A